jgi:glutaredoxin-related protein
MADAPLSAPANGAAAVTLWTSSTLPALKAKTDAGKIRHILDAKRVAYEEVDLDAAPGRRPALEAGAAAAGAEPALPQLHVNGRFVGGADEVQEFEDWGELDALLRGVPPEEVAAASKAAAEAAAAEAAAAEAAAEVE